jgi:hypothetical protein
LKGLDKLTDLLRRKRSECEVAEKIASALLGIVLKHPGNQRLLVRFRLSTDCACVYVMTRVGQNHLISFRVISLISTLAMTTACAG